MATNRSDNPVVSVIRALAKAWVGVMAVAFVLIVVGVLGYSLYKAPIPTTIGIIIPLITAAALLELTKDQEEDE